MVGTRRFREEPAEPRVPVSHGLSRLLVLERLVELSRADLAVDEDHSLFVRNLGHSEKLLYEQGVHLPGRFQPVKISGDPPRKLQLLERVLFELLAQLRLSPMESLRTIPAAALTAYARSEDRTRCLNSGFQMHLSKPIDPSELVAAVAALVRR